MHPRLLGLGSVAVLALSCTSFRSADSARSDFGGRWSCPDDRIVVNRRDDRHDSLLTDDERRAVLQAYPVQSDPSPEVAQDPERLAKWKSDRHEAAQQRDRQLEGLHRDDAVFQVTGCGHSELLTCRNVSYPRWGYTGEVRCGPKLNEGREEPILHPEVPVTP
jgi:hypothetical protein